MSVLMQLSKMGKGIFSYLHMGQIQGVYEAEIKLSSQHTIKNFLSGFQLTLKISTTILNMINWNYWKNWLLIFFNLHLMPKVRARR